MPSLSPDTPDGEDADLQAEVRRGDRRQGEFLARLVHELRNPLAPIRMALQIMDMADDDMATTRAAKAIIDRQLNQLTRLIDSLGEITPLARGTTLVDRQPVSLQNVTNIARQLARPQLESRQNLLTARVPPDTVMIDADASRLAQALANVLINASKYSPVGARIELSCEWSGGHIVLSVSDPGIGIPAPMLARIFEPFVQVDRTGDGTLEGLGIGLSQVKSVVEAHGGKVFAESEGEGQGSRIVLRIPQDRQSNGAAQSPRAVSSVSTKKLRILVADDNRDAAQTLAMMLGFDGHDVRTAQDGIEALAVGAQFAPQLVFLDIGMPVLDGYQTARRIRASAWGRELYLVALTGWGQDADRSHALASGFQDHLVKPAEPETLRTVIDTACSAVTLLNGSKP